MAVNSASIEIWGNSATGYKIPKATLNHIALSNTTSDGLSTYIAAGGVIKRDYVPHDITPLVSVTSVALPVDSTLYSSDDKYFNTETKTLHTFRSNASSGWYWTAGTYGGASTEGQRGQRLYVDVKTNRIYHWHGDDFVQVGFNAEDISSIASAVAVSVVAEYEGQHDQLRTYQVINE